MLFIPTLSVKAEFTAMLRMLSKARNASLAQELLAVLTFVRIYNHSQALQHNPSHWQELPSIDNYCQALPSIAEHCQTLPSETKNY